jgi:tetratricopeptide (TPR) repeat protein
MRFPRFVPALCVVLLAAAAVSAQVPDPEARFNVGLAHLREGRPNMAVEEFKRAIKADGKNPYFYKGLGLALAAQRDFGEAVQAFRKALEINPYYVDVRNDLGTALILSGKRAEGKNEFLTAFNDATNPTPEISSRNLGQAYLEEKAYDQALNWFRTSVGRNKEYPDAYLGLSDALLAMGRTEEAIPLLETGAKECGQAPALQLALGEAYYRVGRFSDARTRLEDARKKDPMGRVGRRAGALLGNFPK